MKIKRLLIFLLVLLALALFSIYYPSIQKAINPTGNAVQESYVEENATLVRVIDGDTIVVNGEEIGNDVHVRLLGINAPEKSMPFSKESANFLKQFVNKTIQLLRDKDDTDMYKRKLRYVFYGERLLDMESLGLGWSSSYYYSGLKYEKELLAAETDARVKGVGIWTKSNETCAVEGCILLNELNPFEEYFTIENNCSFACKLDGWFVKDAGRNTFYLANLSVGEQKTYNSTNGKDIWNNNGDRFFMFDENGLLVVYYSY